MFYSIICKASCKGCCKEFSSIGLHIVKSLTGVKVQIFVIGILCHNKTSVIILTTTYFGSKDGLFVYRLVQSISVQESIFIEIPGLIILAMHEEMAYHILNSIHCRET